MASWVERAGSTLTPVPVTHSSGTSATVVPRDVVGGEGEVRRHGKPVEEQRRVLRRSEGAEHDRREQPVGRADETRVDAEAGQRRPDVVAERVGPHLGEHGAAPPEAGGGHRDVRGGAAEEAIEGADGGQRGTDVLGMPVDRGIEVDADPPDREDLG